jgi:hypothetical protein
MVLALRPAASEAVEVAGDEDLAEEGVVNEAKLLNKPPKPPNKLPSKPLNNNSSNNNNNSTPSI